MLLRFLYVCEHFLPYSNSFGFAYAKEKQPPPPPPPRIHWPTHTHPQTTSPLFPTRFFVRLITSIPPLRYGLTRLSFDLRLEIRPTKKPITKTSNRGECTVLRGRAASVDCVHATGHHSRPAQGSHQRRSDLRVPREVRLVCAA